MAKGLRVQYEAADKALTAAQWGVYAFGTLDNVPWNECWKRASSDAKAAYDKARDKRDAVAQTAVDKGRAWRGDNSNLLFWR